MTKAFTDVEKGQMFKMLARKSYYQVGVEYGLDKLFPTQRRVQDFVRNLSKKVKEAPATYGGGPEALELVEKALAERSIHTVAIREESKQEFSELTDKDLVIGVAKKAWLLFNAKLDYLMKHRKAFRNESAMALAKMAGIAFDKSQIMKGEATEHISLKAQVKEDITSTEALGQILSIRERHASNEE